MSNQDKHYSEKILDSLVKEHGWSNKRWSDDSGESSVQAYVCKKVNGIQFKAEFHSPALRYLELHVVSGNASENDPDIDCRDTDPIETAEIFNGSVEALFNKPENLGVKQYLQQGLDALQAYAELHLCNEGDTCETSQLMCFKNKALDLHAIINGIEKRDLA